MVNWYILNDKNTPVKVDLLTGARWFEENRERRIVAKTKVGKAEVSTVFLGLDHSLSQKGPPILFETMIFYGEKVDDHQERYCTWDKAVEGHNKTVARLQKTRK